MSHSKAFRFLPWWLDQDFLEHVDQEYSKELQSVFSDLQERRGSQLELVSDPQVQPSTSLADPAASLPQPAAFVMSADDRQGGALTTLAKWSRDLRTPINQDYQFKDYLDLKICVETSLLAKSIDELADDTNCIIQIQIRREERLEEAQDSLPTVELWRVTIGLFVAEISLTRIGQDSFGNTSVRADELRRGRYQGNWCSVHSRRVG